MLSFNQHFVLLPAAYYAIVFRASHNLLQNKNLRPPIVTGLFIIQFSIYVIGPPQGDEFTSYIHREPPTKKLAVKLTWFCETFI